MSDYILNWDPSTGIDLGFIKLHYYSMMFALAFLIGAYILKKIFKHDKVDTQLLEQIFVYAVLGVFLGARLGHVIFYDWDYFSNNILEIFLPVKFIPEFKIIGFRGLASHGATIGMAISMYLYNKRILKKSLLWILDRVVIPVSLGGAFVRIGNFINSEIIGKPTDSNFGVVFEALDNIPRYPTQIYESICHVFIFVALWLIYKKTELRNNTGFIFGLFMILLWVARFFIEFFKESQGGIESALNLGLNTGQLLSIPYILIGLFFIFRSLKKDRLS